MDYDTIKNWQFEDIEHRYDAGDAILYALGIGLGADPMDQAQLRFLYEENLLAFPTLAVVLATPGFWLRRPEAGVDWMKVVHGEQRLIMHAPLPASGVVVGKMRVTHVVDKGADKGALVVSERTLHDASGARLVTMTQSSFCRGDGGFGGGDEPAPPLVAVPGSAPARQCRLSVSPRSALIYRLCADRNPLHVDPAVARKAGYPRPILHGLCTYGMAAHAVVRTFCDYDAHRLVELNARFSAPVFPGETILFDFWPGTDGGIQFQARVAERDKVVLSQGLARIQA